MNAQKKSAPAATGNARWKTLPTKVYHGKRKKSRAPMLICIAFVIGLMIGVIATGAICSGIYSMEQSMRERVRTEAVAAWEVRA